MTMDRIDQKEQNDAKKAPIAPIFSIGPHYRIKINISYCLFV